MPRLEVEDHGSGFMVIGTSSVRKAARFLVAYVDDPGAYRFACPTHYEGRCAVWLATGPGDSWIGAVDHVGEPLR